MGLINQSSSPLSSLMPQTSPYQLPDYNKLLQQDQNSTDSIIAYKGKKIPEELGVGKEKKDGDKLTWDQGFQILGDLGSSVGGTVGIALQGAANVRSSINTFSKSVKDAGGWSKLTGKEKLNGIGGIVGVASDTLSAFMPEKTEYSGDKGEITQTMDSVYDGIADKVMSVPGWGALAGGAMKGYKLLGQGMNALGGGTDGETTVDAILGSSFLAFSPFGLINGFGGKTTDTITKNNEVFAQVGSSYGGSEAAVDKALLKSGKKYGLFSESARQRANRIIENAKMQQNLITDISENASDRFNIQSSMSAINENRRAFNLFGGYNQADVKVGKHGMTLELLQKSREILKAQKGSKLTPLDTYYRIIPQNWEIIPKTGKPSYAEWIKDVNPDYQSEWYDLETAYNNLPYNQMQRWKYAVNRPTKKEQDYYLSYNENGYYPFHTDSVAPLQGTKDYIFLKKGTLETNPELKGELDYYDNSGDFKNNYNLSYEGDRYYYRKKKSDVKQETPQHKNGGSIIELVKESIIQLINPEDIPEFQNGGSINVIPDGALHARKHNIDMEGITKKGIPVVDNQGEQQAEVEVAEIILRLEVTQTLEELKKKYYNEESTQKEKDEYALEAGRLIVDELLNNTKDNVGLL